MNTFKQYAEKHNVSIAEAIGDRDWPMTYGECMKAFNECEGRNPTVDEINAMRPDSNETCEEYDAYMRDY